jgi:hypothetical protein
MQMVLMVAGEQVEMIIKDKKGKYFACVCIYMRMFASLFFVNCVSPWYFYTGGYFFNEKKMEICRKSFKFVSQN